MAKLNSRKQKNYAFTKKKSLVGSTPCHNCVLFERHLMFLCKCTHVLSSDDAQISCFANEQKKKKLDFSFFSEHAHKKLNCVKICLKSAGTSKQKMSSYLLK